MAMSIADHFPALAAGGRLRILASDVSPAMVERTKSGRFTEREVGRGIPTQQLVRHFQPDGNEWVANSSLRQVMDCRVISLVAPWMNMPTCDIVVLRNVLIHFNSATKRTILERIRCEILRPGGYLLLGEDETVLDVDGAWTQRYVGRAVFFFSPAADGPDSPGFSERSKPVTPAGRSLFAPVRPSLTSTFATDRTDRSGRADPAGCAS